MVSLFLVLFILCVLYVLAVGGRRGNPGLDALRGHVYAHRGLHDEDLPENSRAAFRAAADAGYGIELDVHLLRDGNLAVMHDAALKRMTGAEGYMEDLTAEELPAYSLCGTGETIPLFRQVLEDVGGRVPLIVELKAERGNAAALAQAACEVLADYPGVYCIESFDPRCLFWLKKYRPEIVRGQLTENFFHDSVQMNVLLRFAMTNLLFNFLTRPDFVAYQYTDRKALSCSLARRLWGLQGAAWTLRTRADFDSAVRDGWLPIFEGFRP